MPAKLDRAAVYDRHLAGHSYDRIAAEFQTSVKAVSKAVESARRDAADELGDQTKNLKVEQTYQLKQLYCEAMEAWRRSQTAEETTKISTTDAGDGKRAERITKRKIGDPRFLAIASGALDSLRRLWHVTPDSQQPTVTTLRVQDETTWFRNNAHEAQEQSELIDPTAAAIAHQA